MNTTRYCFLRVLTIFMCSTLFCLSAGAQEYYKLVTDVSDLEVGKKYIFASMANGEGYVMKKYESGNNCKCQKVNSTEGLIAYASGMAQLTLESSDLRVWTFKDSSNRYMSITSTSGNVLKFNSTSIDSYSKFSISFASDGKATISCNTKKNSTTYSVGFNEVNRVFNSYGYSSNLLYLYEEYNPAKLVSLSISGTPQKTVYIAGETPSAEGLKVVANYDNNTQEAVTGFVEWSFSPLPLQYTTTELTATAAYKGISAKTTFPITVSSKCSLPLNMAIKSFVSADEDNVVWETNIFDIVLNRGKSATPANYFVHTLLENHKETRAYKEQKLIITPKVDVYKIVITAYEYSNSEFSVEKALLQDNITNAKFTIEVDPTVEKRKYITLTPTVESKPIEILLNDKLAMERIVQYYRTFKTTIGETGYATMCLPYAAKVPEGMKAYAAKDDGQKVTLIERGDNNIAANEGVVLYGKGGMYEFIAAENTVKRIDSNEMVGVTKDTTLTAEANAYLLTRKKSDGKVAFRLLNTDYTIPAYRAYLKPKAQNASRVLLDVNEMIETGIESVEETNPRGNTPVIYNLTGQRMRRMQKGINIVNGKLVLR